MPDTEGLPLYLGIAQSVFPSAGITSVNTPNLQHVSFLMNEVPGVGIVNLLELVKLNTIVKTHHRRQLSSSQIYQVSGKESYLGQIRVKPYCN